MRIPSKQIETIENLDFADVTFPGARWRNFKIFRNESVFLKFHQYTGKKIFVIDKKIYTRFPRPFSFCHYVFDNSYEKSSLKSGVTA